MASSSPRKTLSDPAAVFPQESSDRLLEQLKDLCVVLDLCSKADDLLQADLDLFGEGVPGYYKLGEKSLTVVTDREQADPLSWLTYAHEYAHALQDQQFDLSAIGSEGDTFDSSKAAGALVEGDANLTEYLFFESLPAEQQTLLAELREHEIEEFSRSPEAARAPRIIRETFEWEHAAGPEFAFHLYVEGGFEAINEAYQNPPQSTEQVLHFDKYLAGDSPHTVDLPDLSSALDDTWHQRDTGVLGELVTNIYLGTFLSEDQAEAAAQGWGGDRCTLMKDDQGRILIVIRFSWDTVRDAHEFFQAYLDLVDVKSQGRWDLVDAAEGRRLWVAEDMSAYLAMEGDDTLLLIGPDRVTVEAILQVIADTETPM